MSGKCGTRGYIAPEISRHEDELDTQFEVTRAVDMWSFGIVLYELAVGFNPTRVYRSQFTFNQSPNPSVIFECKNEWEKKSGFLIDLIE